MKAESSPKKDEQGEGDRCSRLALFVGLESKGAESGHLYLNVICKSTVFF
jgi:hypothetical protein